MSGGGGGDQVFFFNDTAATEIYTLSLHDALPIYRVELETRGQTSAFLAQLAEYDKAPDVTRKRLYLEAMEIVLSQAGSKTIIDESVRGVLPLLNLDQGTPRRAVETGGAR